MQHELHDREGRQRDAVRSAAFSCTAEVSCGTAAGSGELGVCKACVTQPAAGSGIGVRCGSQAERAGGACVTRRRICVQEDTARAGVARRGGARRKAGSRRDAWRRDAGRSRGESGPELCVRRSSRGEARRKTRGAVGLTRAARTRVEGAASAARACCRWFAEGHGRVESVAARSCRRIRAKAGVDRVRVRFREREVDHDRSLG